MKPRVDLVWIGASGPPLWRLGRTLLSEATPAGVSAVVARELPVSDGDAWLFWDADNGPPDARAVSRTLERPGDVWHAGLACGLQGRPPLLDFVQPAWTLNRDPEPDIESTSWRMTLRAALVKTGVLRQMGGPDADFASLDAAALEMGHRYIHGGVLMRHVPDLAPPSPPGAPELSFEDECLFLRKRFRPAWVRWALFRAICAGSIPVVKGLARVCESWKPPCEAAAFEHDVSARTEGGEQVTVLIPTLDRYRYLYVVLEQLGRQRVPPAEIIVVDQTPGRRRDRGLAERFPGLPLKVICLDEAGQCISRNAGLAEAAGDYVLFLDDDDEIEPDLIEKHLAALAGFRADVSSGVAVEAGAGPLPHDFTFLRASNVFPTNNTMVRRPVLERSGLFDNAYNRGQRADADLGIRIYLTGALMVLNPAISVFHHHAPQGGLRAHRARVTTYASSRRSLFQRHMPSVTEIYLSIRHFSPVQVRESLWMRAAGALSVRGSASRKTVKLLLQLAWMPVTAWQIRKRLAAAQRMLARYPQIPALPRSGHEAPAFGPTVSRAGMAASGPD